MSSISSPVGSKARTASGHIRFFTSETYNGQTSVNDLCCSSVEASCCGEHSISLAKHKTYTRTAKVFFKKA